jgi:hypothetical protein
MKTVLDENNVSVHLWCDEDTPVLTPEGLYFNDNLDDPLLTDSNAQIVENVTPPEDWYGRKYCYVDGQWEINPNDPTVNI